MKPSAVMRSNAGALLLLLAVLIPMLTITSASAAEQAAANQRATELPPLLRPAQTFQHPQRKRAQAFSSFFTTLRELEAGRRSQVTILQLGDSHTAGNAFTSRLRTLFQDRFGAAGQGGLPFKLAGLEVDQKNGTLPGRSWTQAGGLQGASGILGITGFRVSASQRDARLRFQAADGSDFTIVDLDVVTGPKGGTLSVKADDMPLQNVVTRSPVETGRTISLSLPHAAQQLELTLKGDGPVQLLRVSLRRYERGIIYESHGVNGATIEIMDRWHEPTVREQLHRMRPSLIVLAYGTNEGFNLSLSEENYRSAFRKRLAATKSWAPGASILVVGPPDGERLPQGCQPAAALACAPIRTEGAACIWSPPPTLELVRTIQRQEAEAAGVAFWDWSSVMGGPCGTHRWTRLNPPMAQPDHVHFEVSGYQRAADALFTEIMAQYARREPVRPEKLERPRPVTPYSVCKQVLIGSTWRCLN